MKLLDVQVVLDRDKGIQQARQKPEVMKELDDMTTSYAILSHRWGAEVSYEEMIGFMKMEEDEREEVKQRHGYQKIIKSCEQAKKDRYKWLWIDTCCIDKRSSSELSEAINSMYRWYENARVCYAYLNDVESTFPVEPDVNKFGKSNGWPEWFVRGWTLQELIAPKQVEFFNKDWVSIGYKDHFAHTLESTTGIPHDVLTRGLTAKRLSVAQVMSWAADRKTTRVEDRAYSLMGLFGVNMPMLYGEGKRAFQRLQLEIIRVSSDHSIFAWEPRMPRTGSVLAEDPSDFRDCGRIRRLEPDEFVDILKRKYIEGKGLNDPDSRARRQHKLAALRGALDSHQFHTFTVSNAGIQVFLPVVPSRDSPDQTFRAILACTHNGDLVTIGLESFGRSFTRISIDSPLPATYPDFKTLHLIHHQDTLNETRHEFALDDELVSYHGFTRCGTYPREFTGNTVTLSSLSGADDLIVIVYANHDARRYFAIGLGYSLGREWVHFVDDRHSPTRFGKDWREFRRRVYDQMWNARAEHAQIMHEREPYFEHFIKCAHLPRSIWHARVVRSRELPSNIKAIVDVRQCPGCCHESHGWAVASDDETCLAMPKLMGTVFGSYLLELGGRVTKLSKCFGQRFALGDYGDYSRGNLVCTGNIFDNMPATGIDFDESFLPTVHSVSSSTLGRGLDWVKNQDVLAVEHKPKRTTFLALHQPMAISLPVNERLSQLLKALSARLAGKHLVTTVIRCLDFYTVDKDGKQWNSGDYSAPNGGDHSTEAGVLTPLCIISYPHVWSIEPLYKQTEEQFKSIRRNFYILMEMHQPAGTKPSHNSAKKQKKNIAIEFFSDLFGLKHLKNYIGDVAFFARFPSMMQTGSVSDVPSVGATEESGLRGGQQFNVAELDPRLESVLPLLRRRCQAASERPIVGGEIKSILKTPSRDFVKYIVDLLREECNLAGSRTVTYSYLNGDVKRDMQPVILSIIQDIKALQVELHVTQDEGERRALDVDMTGKILWLFWCGIRAEVDELLPKVADYIRREGINEGLLNMCSLMESTTCTDPEDDQAHLRRIMFDARNGISKRCLWLAAHTAEQAKRSGTAGHTSTADTQSGTSQPHQ